MLRLIAKAVPQTTNSIRSATGRKVASFGAAANDNAMAGVRKLSPITVRSRGHLNSAKSTPLTKRPITW